MRDISPHTQRPSLASIFRLPIFWMFLGPPALRLSADDDSRSGLSSLEGDQDIWNYVRLAWWLVWGLAAIVYLVRDRQALSQMLGRTGNLFVWVGLYLGALALSAVFSPVPLFTVANVTMLGLLVVAGIQLAVTLYTGEISVTSVLRRLLVFSVALLLIISVIYALNPQLLWRGWFGLRLRGESFGYTPLLALVTFFLSVHFFLLSRGSKRFPYFVTCAFGCVWLVIGQTRSAYLGLAVGLFVLVWYVGAFKQNLVRLAALAAIGFMGLTTAGLLYNNSDTASWYVDRMYDRFVVRDYWALKSADVRERSFATLNGRTEAATILLEGVARKPLGLGYIGGVRSYMSQPENLERLPSEAFIGAHNGYLEVLGGGGFLAFLGYMLALAWMFIHVRRFRNVEALVVRILLYILLVEGIFESEIAYPFHQSPVLLWIVAGIIVASVARQALPRATGMAPNPAVLRKPHRMVTPAA